MFVSDAVSASAPASHTVPVRSAPFDKTYNVTVTGDAVGQIAEQLSSSPENLALLDSLDGIIENGLYTGSRYEGGSLRLDTFETPVTVGGADHVVTFEARMNSSGVSTLSGLTVQPGTAARDVPGLLAEIAAGKPMEPRLQRIAELTAGGVPDNAGMPARMATDGLEGVPSEFDALPSSMEIMANLTKEDAEAVTQTIIDDAVRAMQNAETGNLFIENQSGAGYNGNAGRTSTESAGETFSQGSNIPDELMETKPKNSPAVNRWLENGGTITIENGTWKYTNSQGVSVLYKNGYPDFLGSGLVVQEVDIGGFRNRSADFRLADKMAPNGPISPDSTWHHHEDGRTLQEVDKSIHRNFTHRGGISGMKK